MSNLSTGMLKALGADKQMRNDAVARLVRAANEQAGFFAEFNDPNAAYARCMACE